MGLLVIILLIVLLLAVLVFSTVLRVRLVFNSDRESISITALWLYPFIKAVVSNEGQGLVLSLLLFKKIVYEKPLKAKPGKGAGNLERIRRINPKDVNVDVSYGFRDPFVTGIACGAIAAASQFIGIGSVNQKPDFTADEDYIYLDATAKVDLGSAIVNLYRAKPV